MSTLQAEVSTPHAEVSTLQTGLASLQAEVATLQTGLASLQAEVATPQTGLASLQAEVATLQTGLASLQAGLVTLPAGITTPHADLESGGTETLRLEAGDQYTIQGDLFGRSMLEDTEPPFSLDGPVRNMAVIEAIFRSAESGRWEAPAIFD